MKTFQRFRTPKEIAAACKKKGFRYSQEQFESGSDYVSFDFKHGVYTARVCYSTVNGNAFGEFWRGKAGVKHRFSTRSDQHESHAWFIALLEFIYA